MAAGALVPKHTLVDETVDEGGLLAEIGQGPAFAVRRDNQTRGEAASAPPRGTGAYSELLDVEFDGRKLKHMLVLP